MGMERCRGVEVKLHAFQIVIFKASSQPHVPVTLSPEKRAQYPLHRRTGLNRILKIKVDTYAGKLIQFIRLLARNIMANKHSTS
jgi:hypothetical protein